MKQDYNFLQILWMDFNRYGRPEKFYEFIKLLLVNPGFRAVLIIRIITHMPKHFRLVAKLLKIRLLQRYGSDVDIDATIDHSLRIEHPVGLVIGRGVRIGTYSTIAHGVTLGEKYIDSRSTGEYPVVGNYVSIGTGAVIIGGIDIGDASTIGANALVLSSVPRGALVVGIWK